MDIGLIQSWDKTVKPLKQTALSIEGLCSVDRIQKNHLLIIDSMSFYKKLNTECLENAWGIILNEKLLEKAQTDGLDGKSQNLYTCEKPSTLLVPLSKYFYDEKYQKIQFEVDGRKLGTVNIDPTAYIAEDVFLGDHVKIGAHAKIHSGVRIGSHVIIEEEAEIFPLSVLYSFVKIGKNVRIHANTTIGADGFGYQFDQGIHQKIWHYGGVEIHDHVEIGANSSVDTGTFEPTIIESGAKIDNMVQIGHNCRIGKNVILCGMVGISGSATIGDYTVIGGKAGIGPGVNIGPQSEIAGNAMVPADWPAKSKIAGHPARPVKEWIKGLATLRKLSNNEISLKS